MTFFVPGFWDFSVYYIALGKERAGGGMHGSRNVVLTVHGKSDIFQDCCIPSISFYG